jgi:hypothetical protein
MNPAILFAQNTTAPEIAGGALAVIVVLWAIGIAATIFWLWMLIDALVNERNPEEKILWFLVIFFLHIIGALIYLFVRKMGRARASGAV